MKEIENFSNNNNTINLHKNNYFKSTKCQQKKKKCKEKIPTLNSYHEIFDTSKLFYSLEGIQYTAIDALKSKVNGNNEYMLAFIQHNMNSFYDLFIKNFNSEFFKNEVKENIIKEVFKSVIQDIMNMDNKISYFKLNNINKNLVRDISIENDKNSIDTRVNLYNKHQNIQNIDKKSNHLLDKLPEEIKNENPSIHNNQKLEESITEYSVDECKYFVKRDILNEYLEHTGIWSSEYLNVTLFEQKQSILSSIIKEVLNFKYGKSEVKHIELKKTHIAGVIDGIQNSEVIRFLKEILENKEILCFTTNDALSACSKAYREEIKTAMCKDKIYLTMEECENQIIENEHSNNQTLETNPDIYKNGNLF